MPLRPGSDQHHLLFQQLLGPSFDILPLPVQQIHQASLVTATGKGSIVRGASLASRIMAWFAKLPPAGTDIPVQVTIRSQAGSERWQRRFGKHKMDSMLRESGGLLAERLGPVNFRFKLQASAEGIRWVPVRMNVLGIPLPLKWFDFAVNETSVDGRYRFDVRVVIAGVGLLVHYQGWLEWPM
jgi:hypothetical protein